MTSIPKPPRAGSADCTQPDQEAGREERALLQNEDTGAQARRVGVLAARKASISACCSGFRGIGIALLQTAP